MNERPCITHSMDKVRPCVIRGYHLDYCSSYAPDGAECTGCLPRPALENMLLCEACYRKFTEAVAMVKDLTVHLRSTDRGSQSIDGIRAGAVVQPSYPISWQEADHLWHELEVLVRATDPEYWGPHYTGDVGFTFSATLDMVADAVQHALDHLHDPDAFLNRHTGAEAAVRFYRAVQLTNRRFNYPLEDPKTVPVKYIYCRSCRGKTLQWVPAIKQFDEVGIECSNPGCRAWYDPVTVVFDMRLLAQQMSEAGHATEAVNAELTRLLRIPERDEAWPICRDCAAKENPLTLARARKPVDEDCRLCGNPTDEGFYRRYAA